MYSLLFFWIWSSFHLLWAIRKGYVVILQGLGENVYLLFHTRSLRMIALTTVCALAHFSFILLLMGVLLGTLGLLLRLGLVYLLFRWLLWVSFLLSFGIHPRISDNQSLVFGRFDGAHHHQFIVFLCEGIHELSKLRNLPGSSCQLCGMEGQ